MSKKDISIPRLTAIRHKSSARGWGRFGKKKYVLIKLQQPGTERFIRKDSPLVTPICSILIRFKIILGYYVIHGVHHDELVLGVDDAGQAKKKAK